MQPVRLVFMAIVAASPVLSVSTVMGCAIISPATVNVSLASLAPSAIKVRVNFIQFYVLTLLTVVSYCLIPNFI